MLKAGMRAWRSHPVLSATAVGAIFGGVYALLIEINGFLHPNASGVLHLLFPAGHPSGIGQMNAVQAAELLLIEVAGNVVGFALLFSIPVAVIVGVRRLFKGRRTKNGLPRDGRP